MSKERAFKWFKRYNITKRDDLRRHYKNNTIPGINQSILESYFSEYKNTNTKSIPPEKTNETQFLKQQLEFTKAENQRLSKENNLNWALTNLFKDTLTRYEPLPYIEPVDNSKSRTNEEMVLVLSDWHIGESVNPDEIDGINEYNVDIARQRISKLIKAVTSIISKMHGYSYKKLNIFCLGDMVSGIIHEELLQGTAAVHQVMIVGDELTRIIRSLLDYFENIEVSCVVGNHGRLTKKPTCKKKFDNFDYLSYQFSAIRFENEPRVKFNIPESALLVQNILGRNFLLRHGDAKVQSYAGIPFYGIKRADTQLRQVYTSLKDINIDYHLLGHFHSQNVMDGIGGKVIMCGSLKGTDELSFNTYLSSSNVRQILLSVHKERGVTWMMDLHCGDN